MRVRLAIFAAVAACGPESSREHEPVSVACATDEPIELSAHPGSRHSLSWAGTDWSMLSGASDTMVVEPCGGGEVHFYADEHSRPLGEGRIACRDGMLGWARDRENVAASLVATEYCEHAIGTDFGVFVEVADRRLLWFRAPDAEPVVLTDRLVWARDFPPRPAVLYDSLWVVDDRAAWFVADDNVLERLELATGERETIASGVVSVGTTVRREAVVWSTLEDGDAGGSTTVHVVDTGTRQSLRGASADLRWSGLVVATDGYQSAEVLDLETGVAQAIRVPSGAPLRAVQGDDFVLWLGIFASAVSDYAIFRVGFDGEIELLAGISTSAVVSIDPHGDGLLVADATASDERPGEPPLERGGLMRVSPTTGVEVLFDAPLSTFAVASDGRILYGPVTPGAPSGRHDLYVRDTDGRDRLFAAGADLVAPIDSWGADADPTRTPTRMDLRGDVLVNRDDGGASRLWRLPFEATP